MRLEVTIPDTSVEAIILKGMADPQTYLLELVRADKGASAKSNGNQSPDYLGLIASAKKSPNRFKTREDIDAYIEGLRAEW